MLKEITEAYQTLSNPSRRKEYDKNMGIKNIYNYVYNEEINTKEIANNTKATNQNDSSENNSYIKRYSDTIKSLIQQELKKPASEQKKDLKALILTILIISILIVIFFKVPFLNNWIFP